MSPELKPFFEHTGVRLRGPTPFQAVVIYHLSDLGRARMRGLQMTPSPRRDNRKTRRTLNKGFRRVANGLAVVHGSRPPHYEPKRQYR